MQPKRGQWRGRIKTTLASAIAGCHEHRLRSRLGRRPVSPLILGYHRVVDDFETAARTEMPSMLVSRAMFERHIDWIGRNFRFIGLDEIGENARTASRRPCAGSRLLRTDLTPGPQRTPRLHQIPLEAGP